MRTKEGFASAGLRNHFGKSGIEISGFFRSVKIIADTERYVAKVLLPIYQDAFETNNYVGGLISFTYLSLNDSIVPTKGITFSGNAAYYNNISRNEFFQKYFGKLQLYIPLGNKFSLAIRTGASTIVGDSAIYNSAEFYEHSVIGAAELRGFKRERFWGKTSFYNNNELRFITNIRTHLLNAKAGLLVFYDDGRVWMPGEKNNTFHTGYGGGILLAPFNMAAVTLTYGISKESNLFQIRVNKLF
jgi:hemolysin activation/secretion protein